MNDYSEIINVLKKGEVAILPSDTIYGLFADALNIDAIKKVDDIKHSNKPHLILISNINMLDRYVKNLSSLHKQVINKYWPGPLTILFEKSDLIPDELTKGSEYVGIRLPNNKMLIDLINEYDKPLLSTSANITNEDVITNVNMLDKSIKDKVSFIYDGGTLNSVASTLIKIENDKIILLREGSLASQIKEDFKNNI